MELKTNDQYDEAVASCTDVFLNKTKDYGTSWRCLRIISIADQVYIKAMRIRTIQEKKIQMVGDDIAAEFKGIVNYGIIGLIQFNIGNATVEEIDPVDAKNMYSASLTLARNTMINKNHDYGEAWRDMSQESFVDLIITKISRIKQILSNDGKTLVSEGIDANFTDIINYAIFGLILIGEGKAGHLT